MYVLSPVNLNFSKSIFYDTDSTTTMWPQVPLEGKRKMLLPPIRRMSRLFLRHLPCNSPWVAMDNNPPKKDGCNLNYNSSLLINVVVVINEELNHCHSSEIGGFMLDEIFQIF